MWNMGLFVAQPRATRTPETIKFTTLDKICVSLFTSLRAQAHPKIFAFDFFTIYLKRELQRKRKDKMTGLLIMLLLAVMFACQLAYSMPMSVQVINLCLLLTCEIFLVIDLQITNIIAHC